MSVPILTAVTGAAWEATFVASLERRSAGVNVVRRCVDLADLLAAATSGTARAVLLSTDLRRLDRDALARLAAAGVVVVGLYTPGDETAQRRLRQLGVRYLVPADAPPEQLGEVVAAAVLAGPAGEPTGVGWGDPAAALPTDPDVGSEDIDPGVAPGTGRLVAVWGPTGAPGRTTVAVTLATELARLGVPTVLADADVYGGVVAQVLGLLDESPGLAAAVRLATTGMLDLRALAKLAPAIDGSLRVLTGITRAQRWPELRPAGLEVVWSLARSLAELTVVDCGFALEQDEEISFDTAAPRRNGATAVTLDEADVIVAVGAADPIGLQRLVRGLAELREAHPAAQVRVVVTKVRRATVGPDTERQITSALERYAGVREPVLVPYDRAGLDVALLAGRSLAEAAASSPARAPLAALAADLAGRSPAANASTRRARSITPRRAG